jgi:DNA polymerase epsilon subunit 1
MARGRGSFGLSSARGRGRGSFRSGYRGGSWRGGRGRGRGGSKTAGESAPQREDDGTKLAERFEQVQLNDEIDEKLGFARVQEGGRREGWLVNMHPVSSAVLHAAQILTQNE